MIHSMHGSIVVVNVEFLNGNFKEYYKLNDNFYSKYEPTVFGNSKILFVGVLYNVEELKVKYNCKIENISEMIGCLYNKHGKKFLDSLDGSFSLVIVQENRIILLRDYFGLESLYYFSIKSNIKIISNNISEIKKYIRLSINEEFLVHYFLYEDHTDWQTIYENINAIPLFEFLEYDTKKNAYKFNYIVKSPFCPNNELLISEQELLNVIESTLEKRVKQLIDGWKNDSVINMMSGGVDSSYIAVLLSKFGFNNSFSASFEKVGGDYQYAIDIADYMKLNHKNIFINDDIFFDGIVDSVKKSELPYAYKGESFFNIIYNVFQNSSQKILFFNGTGADAIFSYGREMKLLRLLELSTSGVNLLNSSLGRLYSEKYYNLIKLLIRDSKNNYFSKDLLKLYLGVNSKREFEVKKLFGITKLPELFERQIKKINEFPTTIDDKIFKIHAYYGMARIPNMTSLIANKKKINVVFPFLDRQLFEIMQSVPLRRKSIFKSKKHFLKKLLIQKIPKDFVYRKKIMLEVPYSEIFKSNKKFKNIIEEINDAHYNYFQLDNKIIFENDKYSRFAMRIINFHLINKYFINNS